MSGIGGMSAHHRAPRLLADVGGTGGGGDGGNVGHGFILTHPCAGQVQIDPTYTSRYQIGPFPNGYHHGRLAWDDSVMIAHQLNSVS